MRRIFVTLAIFFLSVITLPVYEADSRTGLAFNPLTGDTAFDATLGDLNIQTQGKGLSDFITKRQNLKRAPQKRKRRKRNR